MLESFLNSIYLISEEYFINENLRNLELEISCEFYEKIKENERIFNLILTEVFSINKSYEFEIKHIMKENQIAIETELVYLTDFIEPKIAIFKNDIEDYRLNLNEQIDFCKGNSIRKLNNLREKYKFLNEKDVEILLFVSVYWIIGYQVKVKSKQNNSLLNIDINDVMANQVRILNQRDLIERLVKHKDIDILRNYYFENIKLFSLYNFYVNNNNDNSNNIISN